MMGSWIVGGIVFMIAGLAGFSIYKDKRKGNGCGGCRGCPNASVCPGASNNSK